MTVNNRDVKVAAKIGKDLFLHPQNIAFAGNLQARTPYTGSSVIEATGAPSSGPLSNSLEGVHLLVLRSTLPFLTYLVRSKLSG